jgi:DNA helicase-2/ATP-dependent DNA helicase PcrA
MNPLQYALFTAIRGGRPDVFVVGDPLQAIYGWNGADRMLFDTLPEQLGQTTMLKLPNNYRCTPHIVHAARHAARHAGEPVDIVAVREDGAPVHVVGFDTAEAEAKGIAQLLWKYAPTAGADPWSSVAVLVRTNIQVAAIAKELKKAGIPIGSSKQSVDITAAIGMAAQCGSRNALATWAADTMAESLDDAEREVAAMVFEFLHLDQPGVVDGRAFTAWTTANHIAKAADSGVDLLTFHGAKGREWNCVVVAGAETGLLPHGSATSADQKKEEVRLAYVALTRAANQLYVTYAEKRGTRNAGISPLVEGMPKRAPSPEELAREEAAAAVRAAMPRTNSGQPTVLDKLTTWRRHLARSSNLTPQEICSDADLLELSSMTPKGVEDFAPIFGDMTAQRVGPALLEILAINSGLIDTNIA